MPVIRVFEPALCCNTGVCGPQLDQELVNFTAAVSELKTRGVDIERANLASEPSQFAHNPVVVNFLRTAGSEGLPLTLVDDVTVLTGRHPRLEELERYAGLTDTSRTECCSSDTATPSSCCGSQTILPVPAVGGCCDSTNAPSTESGCC